MSSSKSSSHSACTERRAKLPRPQLPRAPIVQAVHLAAPEARSRSCAGGASDARQRLRDHSVNRPMCISDSAGTVESTRDSSRDDRGAHVPGRRPNGGRGPAPRGRMWRGLVAWRHAAVGPPALASAVRLLTLRKSRRGALMRVGFRIAVVLVCAACGGGTGGDGSTSIPSVSITVTPAAVSLATGATQQLAAVVTGAADTSVAWSVGEGAVGGDVSASGLYTAPASAGTFHVVATSNADRTKSATVTATVTARQPLPTVRVSIDPTSVSLHVGETTTFDAQVTGTNHTEVAWSADGGAVDQAGLFTAPSSP